MGDGCYNRRLRLSENLNQIFIVLLVTVHYYRNNRLDINQNVKRNKRTTKCAHHILPMVIITKT